MSKGTEACPAPCPSLGSRRGLWWGEGLRQAPSVYLVTHIPYLLPVLGRDSFCVWPGPFSAKPRSSSWMKQQQLWI